MGWDYDRIFNCFWKAPNHTPATWYHELHKTAFSAPKPSPQSVGQLNPALHPAAPIIQLGPFFCIKIDKPIKFSMQIPFYHWKMAKLMNDYFLTLYDLRLGEISQWLKGLASRAEDQSSAASTNTEQPTTACNSRVCDTLFWSLRYLHTRVHIQTYNIFFLNSDLLLINTCFIYLFYILHL